MPSEDRRANDMHNNTWSGVVKKGTGPREAPPKMWDPSKPPGGKLPRKGPEPDKQS